MRVFFKFQIPRKRDFSPIPFLLLRFAAAGAAVSWLRSRECCAPHFVSMAVTGVQREENGRGMCFDTIQFLGRENPKRERKSWETIESPFFLVERERRHEQTQFDFIYFPSVPFRSDKMKHQKWVPRRRHSAPGVAGATTIVVLQRGKERNPEWKGCSPKAFSRSPHATKSRPDGTCLVAREISWSKVSFFFEKPAFN